MCLAARTSTSCGVAVTAIEILLVTRRVDQGIPLVRRVRPQVQRQREQEPLAEVAAFAHVEPQPGERVTGHAASGARNWKRGGDRRNHTRAAAQPNASPAPAASTALTSSPAATILAIEAPARSPARGGT